MMGSLDYSLRTPEAINRPPEEVITLAIQEFIQNAIIGELFYDSPIRYPLQEGLHYICEMRVQLVLMRTIEALSAEAVHVRLI